MMITEFIPSGKGNAISVKELEALTGKTQREIGRLIREARCNGAVILSSSKGGYWLPDYNDKDIKEQISTFIRFMDSKNTFSATKTAKAALKDIDNAMQMHLGGF